MKFTPGFLTKPQADELTKLTERPGLGDVWATPPLQMTRGPGGQPAITLPPPESWWAKLTATTAGAWTWAEWAETSAGVWAVKPFGETGTLNAYPVPGAVGIIGATVRMWRSRNADDAFEFSGSAGGKVHGKLSGTLSFGGSATMVVWKRTAGVEAATATSLTVYDWLLSSGQSIASGVKVTAFYDVESEVWYVDGAACP